MNDIKFLRHTYKLLLDHSIDNYVFGGWAEELHGLRLSGPHSDIDLLIRDSSFAKLDKFVECTVDFNAIPEKRFTHKRAFEYQSVRIELFLVDPESMTTDFFDGRYLFRWPDDVFCDKVESDGLFIHLCSKTALQLYRSKQKEILTERIANLNLKDCVDLTRSISIYCSRSPE